MMMVGYLVAVLMLVVAACVAFGWTIPLVVGLVLKGRRMPGHRGWLITSGIWGGASLLIVAGVIAFAWLQVRSLRGGASGSAHVETFRADEYGGPAASFTFDPAWRARVVGTVGGRSLRMDSANGVLVVPAGSIKVTMCEWRAHDAKNREWVIRNDWDGEQAFDVGAAEQSPPPWGPPFSAAVRVTYSAASDSISLEPVLEDAAGHVYRVQTPRGANGVTPAFEMVDAGGKVVLRGSFEYG